MKKVLKVLVCVLLLLVLSSCQKDKVNNEVFADNNSEYTPEQSRELVIKFTQDSLLNRVGNKLENVPVIAFYNDNTFEFSCNCYSEMVMFSGIWHDLNNSIYECTIESFKDSEKNDVRINGIDDDIFSYFNITSNEFDICYLDGSDTAAFNSMSSMGMTSPGDIFFINHNVVETNNNVNLPKVSVGSNILGTSYQVFKANGNTEYEVRAHRGFLKCINDTEEDGIDYFCIDDNTYVGVKDGVIVMYATYGHPTKYQVNDWVVNDAFYLTTPQIHLKDHRGYIGWELDNGYLIISVISTGGEWYNFMSDFIIYLKDISQCNIEWE